MLPLDCSGDSRGDTARGHGAGHQAHGAEGPLPGEML